MRGDDYADALPGLIDEISEVCAGYSDGNRLGAHGQSLQKYLEAAKA